ncbi:hypothetical protein PDE_00863 [Penicillium oxalicum 114-2]|uniref:Uncharacterized protein n=1 Tax=Penicillium oxalicum (strain 114-2 / CGMCC 5302) TaxID=933388 RepID=S8AVM9_PENO1|nr:hypothetical protein PDE_00863 [Penicillium oxalicum 114-2]
MAKMIQVPITPAAAALPASALPAPASAPNLHCWGYCKGPPTPRESQSTQPSGPRVLAPHITDLPGSLYCSDLALHPYPYPPGPCMSYLDTRADGALPRTTVAWPGCNTLGLLACGQYGHTLQYNIKRW